MLSGIPVRLKQLVSFAHREPSRRSRRKIGRRQQGRCKNRCLLTGPCSHFPSNCLARLRTPERAREDNSCVRLAAPPAGTRSAAGRSRKTMARLQPVAEGDGPSPARPPMFGRSVLGEARRWMDGWKIEYRMELPHCPHSLKVAGVLPLPCKLTGRKDKNQNDRFRLHRHRSQRPQTSLHT